MGLPHHLKFFQGHFFQRDMLGYFHTFMGVRRGGETGICLPGNRTKKQKILENLKSSFLIPINSFNSCNNISFTGMALTLHKSQLHCSGAMQ